MRRLLKTKHFTKSERIFGELLKTKRIPFKTKINIEGREIDFLIGNYVIEIESHAQDPGKNSFLIDKGYIPIHFTNRDIKFNRPLILKWLEQTFSPPRHLP